MIKLLNLLKEFTEPDKNLEQSVRQLMIKLSNEIQQISDAEKPKPSLFSNPFKKTIPAQKVRNMLTRGELHFKFDQILKKHGMGRGGGHLSDISRDGLLELYQELKKLEREIEGHTMLKGIK